MNFDQHPLSKAFPRMPTSEFNGLINDIRQHGQREPITIFEGMILDGWHRYRAMQFLDAKPHTCQLAKNADPVAFVLSRNLHRRHLNASQRAVAVVDCSKWKPVGRPPKESATESPLSNGQMAKMADVSESTIKDAKAVVVAGKQEEVHNGSASAKSIARPPKPKPAPPVEEHEDAPSIADMAGEMESLHKENGEKDTIITSLQVTDKDKEIVKLHQTNGALHARVTQQAATQAEAEKLARYRGDLLQKIKKELNVQKDAEILPAIKALK